MDHDKDAVKLDEGKIAEDEDLKSTDTLVKTLINGSVDQDSVVTVRKDKPESSTSSPWQPYSGSAFNSTLSRAPDMPPSSSSAPFPSFSNTSMPPLSSDSVKREPGIPDSLVDRPPPPVAGWPGLGGPPPFLPPSWQLPDLGRPNPEGPGSLDLTLARSMAPSGSQEEMLLRQQLPPYLPPPLLPGGPYDPVLQGGRLPLHAPPPPDFMPGGACGPSGPYGGRPGSSSTSMEMEFETPSDSEMDLRRSPSPEPQRVNVNLCQTKNAMYVLQCIYVIASSSLGRMS